MKNAYYFSHDSNARHDPKILALRSAYGVKGYGWFWIILEVMREQSDYCLTVDKYLYNAMALEMQCNCIVAEKFINDCVEEFGLFIKEGNKIFSESLIERMKKADEKIEKARESANKRWSKQDTFKIKTDDINANAMPTQCDSNAINEMKVKEIKELNTIAIDLSVEKSKAVQSKISFDREERKFIGITEKDIDLWMAAYPAVDLNIETSKAIAWIFSAGSKGYKSNWRKFLTGWYNRAQDRGGSGGNRQ